MKKTCNLIVGGVVAIGVLAAIGAITVARYAAKHMDKPEVPNDCDCNGDCEHCPMNDPEVEVELEVQSDKTPVEEVNVEVAEPEMAVQNVAEEVVANENTEL